MSMKESEKGLSAGEKEYLRKEYLRAFVDYKKNYSNDTPSGLSLLIRIFTLALDLVHLLEINDPGIVTRCQSFRSFVDSIKKRELSPNAPLSEKDIEETDIFLDYIIAKLQK